MPMDITYYCSNKFNSLWVGNKIKYSIIFTGRNGENSWDLERTLLNYLAFWDVKYNIGYRDPSGVNFTFNRNTDCWGRCILNNAIYDYCDIALREGLSRPPKKLIVASSGIEKTWKEAYSAPILTNIYTWKLALVDAYLSATITPFGVKALHSLYPDLILKYPKAPFYSANWSNSNDLLNYNYTISSTWHELIHTAQFNRFKKEKGYWAASKYFFTYGTTVIKHYFDDKNKTYGVKGDEHWESMALSEGWAYYNEWRIAKKHLNFNSFAHIEWSEDKRNPLFLELDDTYFPKYYSGMFYELFNIGCSIYFMEKALCTDNIATFKKNLITYYPRLKSKIEPIITKYE